MPTLPALRERVLATAPVLTEVNGTTLFWVSVKSAPGARLAMTGLVRVLLVRVWAAALRVKVSSATAGTRWPLVVPEVCLMLVRVRTLSTSASATTEEAAMRSVAVRVPVPVALREALLPTTIAAWVLVPLVRFVKARLPERTLSVNARVLRVGPVVWVTKRLVPSHSIAPASAVVKLVPAVNFRGARVVVPAFRCRRPVGVVVPIPTLPAKYAPPSAFKIALSAPFTCHLTRSTAVVLRALKMKAGSLVCAGEVCVLNDIGSEGTLPRLIHAPFVPPILVLPQEPTVVLLIRM